MSDAICRWRGVRPLPVCLASSAGRQSCHASYEGRREVRRALQLARRRRLDRCDQVGQRLLGGDEPRRACLENPHDRVVVGRNPQRDDLTIAYAEAQL